MDYIVDNIKQIMEERNLSASEFADQIGVQRASISHILSGRNKPSLDFILKVCNAFEDLNPNTLLLEDSEQKKLKQDFTNLSKEAVITENNQDGVLKKKESNLIIERIVIFYTNKSFTEHIPNESASIL